MFRRLVLLLGVLLVSGTVLAQSTDLATDFTYQGYLQENGIALTDSCDMRFALYNEVTAGTQIGSTLEIFDVALSNGVFDVVLDFGVAAFDGQDHYLEIAIDTGCEGLGSYTTLSPRQPLTPAPYAIALYGLRTETNSFSPNIIGGYSGNRTASGVVGATIDGGGSSVGPNIVYDDYGTVGGGSNNVVGSDDDNSDLDTWATIAGGANNIASNFYAAIGGGVSNTASGPSSTIGGGLRNIATAPYAMIGGGRNNVVLAQFGTIAGGGGSDDPTDEMLSGDDGNIVYDEYGFIGSGAGNRAGSDDADPASNTAASVVGGRLNQASGSQSVVGAGLSNSASGNQSVVGGGSLNTASATQSFVGSGLNNGATGVQSFVGAGSQNVASGTQSFVGSGIFNNAAGDYSFVGGGFQNVASGLYATASGGLLNRADGDYSFAAGRFAQTTGTSTFIWNDGSISSNFPNSNRFIVVSSGGAVFYTGSLSTGVTLPSGGSGWIAVSDRNTKENFETVDPVSVLEQLVAMPVTEWNYITQDDGIRHMGVMAQDFDAAFGLGEDPLGINSIDMDGVTIAAIQGLYQQNQAQQAAIQRLEERLGRLELLLLAILGAGFWSLCRRKPNRLF